MQNAIQGFDTNEHRYKTSFPLHLAQISFFLLRHTVGRMPLRTLDATERFMLMVVLVTVVLVKILRPMRVLVSMTFFISLIPQKKNTDGTEYIISPCLVITNI